jgi:hypothetical protein
VPLTGIYFRLRISFNGRRADSGAASNLCGKK